MKNENYEYLLSKDGAQVYADEKMMIISRAAIGNGLTGSSKSVVGMKTPLVKQSILDMSEYLFWVSIMERFFLSYEYFNENKDRVSCYLVPVDSIHLHMSSLELSEISRKRRQDTKIDFMSFIENLDGAVVSKTEIGTKSEIYKVEITAEKYIQSSKLLYDKIWLTHKGSTRSIKNAISIFLSIMNFARRKMSNNGGTLDSSVCFGSLDSIGEVSGLTRKTVSSYIDSLSRAKILSYAVLKKRNSSREKYFITDSLSESILFDHIHYKYRSYDVQDLVRSCTTAGYYEVGGKDCTVDFNSIRMRFAREKLIEMKLI